MMRRETIDLKIKISHMMALGFFYDYQQKLLLKNFIVLSLHDLADMNTDQMSKVNWLAERHFQFVDKENLENGLLGCKASVFMDKDYDSEMPFKKYYKRTIKKIKPSMM